MLTSEISHNFKNDVSHPEYLPAIFEKVVFLRAHHLEHWPRFLKSVTFDLSSPTEFDEKLARAMFWGDHVRNFPNKKRQILEGKIDPRRAGIEIDFFNVIHDRESSTLTERDRQRLEELQVNMNSFEELIRSEVAAYKKIWDLPDNAKLVVSRKLDYQCVIQSKEGFAHCVLDIPEPNTDTSTLVGLSQMKDEPLIPDEIKSQIQVLYDKQDPDRIVAVILPIAFLRTKRNILLAQQASHSALKELNEIASKK